MKKLLSMLLVCVMLLSTIALCGFEAKAADVEAKPFYLSNWDECYTADNPYIWQKAYFWIAPGTEDSSKIGYNSGHDIPSMAAELKKTFDKYPEGAKMRIMNITPVERHFLSEKVEDYVYFDKGTALFKAWMTEFLEEYKRIGGKLDGVHSDLEYIRGYYWYLYSEQYNMGNVEVYYNITQHPSYQTVLRPMLEERGFKFYQPLATMTDAMKKVYCELYSLHPQSGAQFEESRYIWDVVQRNMHSIYLNECLWEPLQATFPDAYVDDYNSRDTYGWMKNVPETGTPMYHGGNYIKVGNASNFNNYNYGPDWVIPSENNTSYRKPVSHIDAIYEDNAFNMTLWEINTAKDMLAATDTKNIVIPVTTYAYGQEYGNDPEGSSSGTPYHVEGYFHLGMANAEFGGYIIQNESPNTAEYKFRLEVVSAILAELTRVAGYADRRPIEMPSNWNDSFILSGMYANGRNIWRITPDTITGVSKKNFLVSTDNGQIVFKNKGQTITFPQGTIIEDSFIPAVGTCGYWVETPADVMPTITNDANRYEKYPAYSERFDNYQTGINFDHKVNKYSHTWESWIQSNGSVTIQENPSNAKDKMLAITGDAFLNTTKIPSYIIAGDTYAKQQAWEVTFNLSAIPSGNAEIKLLNTTSGTGINTDGGFRIFDGKLYYGPTDGYVAFENVTLQANTDYRVKRVLDLRDGSAYTCDYYVYDANGNLLDKAEGVAMPLIKVPTEKIGFSTVEFGSNTLYIDDYKISIAGLSTDLSVYNANTGMPVDATVAQNTDTAYRLSWVNASNLTKTYNILATYSDGTKEVLETVVMKPGSDAVNTGIVKVNGKSVTISIEEIASSGPDNDNDNGSNNSGNGGASADNGSFGGLFGSGENGSASVLLIIIAALLFVILDGVFAACLLITGTPKQQKLFMKQKPKAKAPVEEIDEETDAE